MVIIHYAVSTRNVWKLGSTLNYINILQPVYFNVFLHGNFLKCKYFKILTNIFNHKISYNV